LTWVGNLESLSLEQWFVTREGMSTYRFQKLQKNLQISKVTKNFEITLLMSRN